MSEDGQTVKETSTTDDKAPGKTAGGATETVTMRGDDRTGGRWTVRDVITLVAFNLIIIAITFILKMIEDLLFSPQTEFFIGSWLFPLASTPFYLVMADRIGKRGVLAVTTLVFGMLYTLMGSPYCLPIALVGAVVGELAMWGKDSYRSPVRATIGFFIYWVVFGFYGVIPYLLFQDAYVAQLSTFYSTEDVMAMIAQYTELPWILLMMAQFALGTTVGGFIGTRLLKKHVRKAKIA
ncbi:MptD family putative ECF transporter S component [Cryptobacterium curtum]